MKLIDRWVAMFALMTFVAITLGTAGFVAAAFPTADLSEPLGDESVGSSLLAAIELYAVLCATALMPPFLWLLWVRRFGGPLKVLGLTGQERVRSLVRGSVGGCLLILLLCGLLVGAGWYRISGAGVDSSFVAVLFGLALAALYEELLFRGFGFWLIERAAGPILAIASSSILFALAHSDNSGAHWLGMINTVLAGVVLALLRWRSGNLWSAWGVHFGWNVALGLLFGAKTSGFAFAGRFLEAETTVAGARHVILAGGGYGPEGSAVLTPLLILTAVWLLRQGRTSTEVPDPVST